MRFKPDVKKTVCPFNLDVVRLRVDKGIKFTGEQFRATYTKVDIRFEFAATVTALKIGATERNGRMVIEKTCCFLLALSLM